MKKNYLLLALGAMLLHSCEKAEPLCTLQSPEFTVNGIEAAGSSVDIEVLNNGAIVLTAPGNTMDYHWTGPNGFEASGETVTIPDATAEMSGTYTLTRSRGICTGTSSTNINITQLVVPCSPVDNRLTWSNTSLNSANFYYVNSSVSQDHFQIQANGSNADLTITFASDVPPETGVYTIGADCPSSSWLAMDEVCISLVYSNQWCYAEGGTLYVTRNDDGTYVAVFCDLLFNSPFPWELIGSAKLVE